MQENALGVHVYAAVALAVAAAALTVQHDRSVAVQELRSVALSALALEGQAETSPVDARAVVAR